MGRRIDEKVSEYLKAVTEEFPLKLTANGFVVKPTDSNGGDNGLFKFIMSRARALTGCRSENQFPGSQPVSMTKHNLRHFIMRPTNDYIAYEKSDGLRYVVYICMYSTIVPYLASLPPTAANIRRKSSSPDILTFMIPRSYLKEGIYLVDIAYAPSVMEARVASGKHVLEEAVLDCEYLVKLKSDGKRTDKRLLIFDLMAIGGESHVEKTLSERRRICDEQLMIPQTRWIESFTAGTARPNEKIPISMVTFEMKRAYASNEIEYLLKTVIPGQAHSNDGVVFTRDAEYKIGTDESLIKWKPQNLNSVDLALRRERCGRHMVWSLQYAIGDEIDGADIPFDPELSDALERELQKRIEKGEIEDGDIHFGMTDSGVKIRTLIVECIKGDGEGHAFVADSSEPSGVKSIKIGSGTPYPLWRVIHLRTDKTKPNAEHVYHNVLKSIDDNIDENMLIRMVGSKRKAAPVIRRTREVPPAAGSGMDRAKIVVQDEFFQTRMPTSTWWTK